CLMAFLRRNRYAVLNVCVIVFLAGFVYVRWGDIDMFLIFILILCSLVIPAQSLARSGRFTWLPAGVWSAFFILLLVGVWEGRLYQESRVFEAIALIG